MQPRIMYIERKAGQISGDARIGRVTFSRTRKTIYYRGKQFQSLKGSGYKANYFDVDSGEDYWISGCKRDGRDRLCWDGAAIDIDDDVREEYWVNIRRLSGRKNDRVTWPR
jgi:hypothetical protein